MRRLLLAPAVLALAAATALTARRMEVGADQPYDIAVLPRAAPLRWMSLGHPTLAANLLWLRAVQYIGEPRADRRGWEKLYPVVDVITDLDPRHGYAYQVAGVILGGVGRVAESNAILEKGMRNVPDRYVLPLIRAFNAFYYQDDWAAAGCFAEAAARAPGAPAHVRATALAFDVKGRRADRAVAFLTEMRAEAQDDDSRKAIDEQLRQARIEAAAEPVDEALARYRRDHGLDPLWLGRLVDEGYLPAIPPDPAGGHWVVGDGGRVHSSVQPFRFRPAPRHDQLPPEPRIQDSQR